MVAPLALRKQVEFPDDRRMVLDVQVTEIDDGRFHVMATSMDSK